MRVVCVWMWLLSSFVALQLPATPRCRGLAVLGAERKAEWISDERDLVGAFAEIGAAQKVADRVLASGAPKGDLRFFSPYDMSASDRRYGRAGEDYNPRHYISRKRLEAQLAGELARLPKDPTKRRFVFADTIATSRGGGHGWMGFQGELVPGGPEVRVMMHGRMFGASAREQRLDLGNVGINLIYGAFHHLATPEKFFASLLDGIRAGNVQVDACYIDGPGAPVLTRETIARHLVEAKLATRIGLAPGGDFAVDEEIVPRERSRRFALETVDDFTDLAAWKARRINSFDNLKGIVVEVGDGNRLAGRVFDAPTGRTVYETISYPTLAASRERYPTMGNHPELAKLLEQLDAEYPHVTYHRPHRKFVLATLVEAIADGLEGWIGLRVQHKKDEAPHTYHAHVRIHGGEPSDRREWLANIGVNLLYEALHAGPEGVAKKLGEGLPEGALEVVEYAQK